MILHNEKTLKLFKNRTKKMCRICFDDIESTQGDELNPIISICFCRNENGNIHLNCLRNWVNMG
jgi:E3 ubiquitin-protein ligase DOA10